MSISARVNSFTPFQIPSRLYLSDFVPIDTRGSNSCPNVNKVWSNHHQMNVETPDLGSMTSTLQGPRSIRKVLSLGDW